MLSKVGRSKHLVGFENHPVSFHDKDVDIVFELLARSMRVN